MTRRNIWMFIEVREPMVPLRSLLSVDSGEYLDSILSVDSGEYLDSFLSVDSGEYLDVYLGSRRLDFFLRPVSLLCPVFLLRRVRSPPPRPKILAKILYGENGLLASSMSGFIYKSPVFTLKISKIAFDIFVLDGGFFTLS